MAVPPKKRLRAKRARFYRHQLDQALFLGGREYQRLFDSTQIGLVRSVDLERTRVSGGLRALIL